MIKPPGESRQDPPAGAPAAVRTIVRVRGSAAACEPDAVVSEAHLRIVAEDRLLAVLACSPVDLEDLVLGFLFGQAVIDRPGDLDRIAWAAAPEDARGHERVAAVAFCDPARAPRAEARLAAARFVASGCASAPPAAPVPGTGPAGTPPAREPRRQGGGDPGGAAPVELGTVAELAAALQRSSPLFEATGGAHAAAISGPLQDTGARLLAVREDIGRHNAVDKVAGHCLRQGVSAADKALLVTGRVSVEIVAKADRLGCPVIISRSAPTDLAVDYAGGAGITLIGFARGERLNVYANWWRLRCGKRRP